MGTHFGPVLTSPPTNHSEVERFDIKQLTAMFPSIDEDVLSQILAAHNNDAEAAALALIDFEVTESDADADIARKLQLEQDEEFAKNVHESLQREMEADAKKQQELPAVASRALSSAAQKFLHRVSKPKQQATSTHAAPLLDTPLKTPLEGSYDMRPLAASCDYAPPSMTVAQPKERRPNDSNSARSSASSADSSARYSSRMDRARAANRQRTRLSQTHESIAPLQMAMPTVATPAEGELILAIEPLWHTLSLTAAPGWRPTGLCDVGPSHVV